MATANPTHPPGPTAAPATGRLPVAAAALTTVAFAGAAFRLSFAALTDLATDHGVAPDIAWVFAALVDGGAVVGTVGVVAARRAGRRTAAYWATVVVFAAVSLAFNVAHSDGTTVGIAIAVVPPVAQLVATELLVRMLPTAGGGAAGVDVAPAVAAATDAAQRALDAATDARTAANQLTTDARRATHAAARAETAAATLTTATAPPLALTDLAAAVAAVTDTPPTTDTTTTGDGEPPPAPAPLAVTFTAPPLPPADDPTPADTTPPPARRRHTGTPPDAAIAAYHRIHRTTGRRPTAEALGAALGVRRTRGGELRRMVETVINL